MKLSYIKYFPNGSVEEHYPNSPVLYAMSDDERKVPEVVENEIKRHRSKVYGFNACLALLKDPSCVNLYDYTAHHIDKPFLKGFTIARKSAIKAVEEKADELNDKDSE